MLKTKLAACVLALALASIGSCKGFLDVENPGPIEDENLQTPDAIPSLVTGMSADLSEELDEIVRLTSVVGDELVHGGALRLPQAAHVVLAARHHSTRGRERAVGGHA